MMREQAVERLASDWHYEAMRESREGRQDGLTWAQHYASVQELQSLDESIDYLLPLTSEHVAQAARPGCDADDFWFDAASAENLDELRHRETYLFGFLESVIEFWHDVRADVERARMQLA